MSSEIVVGDWVVVGSTREDREVGQIVSIDGDMASVRWAVSGDGACHAVRLSRRDVEVYGNRVDAEERERELDAEEES
jgi:hypothetical protein